MAQIPYSPVPTVAPTEAATPGFRLNTPEAAFGGATAAAIEGLGHVTEQAGNELFGRAIALQQLNNESEAREADAKYMMAAGDLHAKYQALEGKARVDAFPQYSKDLQDLRVKIRGSLSNPMAMKLYDASSLSTMGRSIFNGAGAAASANKEWAHGAVTAQHDLLVKQVYDDPNDDTAFRQAIANNHTTAVSRAALTAGGASPERIELITRQGDSTIAANRILGMARNQPYQASQLLKKYKEEGLLFGKDYEVVSNKVQSLTQTVWTNSNANQVLGKYLQSDGTYSKSAQEMQAEAVETATKAYPDDPKMPTAAEGAFNSEYEKRQRAKFFDEREVKQQLQTYIVKGVNTVDMLPPDLIKRMSPTQIKSFPAEANSYQRSVDTQTHQATYEKFLGLYNNDNGKFMETNFMAEPGLSKGDRDKFIALQRKIAANGDPRVDKAMKQLRGFAPSTLTDLGVIGKNRNEDTANQFVGALHEAIQSYQETNGKPPDEKTITKEIFPAITRDVTQKGWLWDSHEHFFSAPVPDEYTNLYRKSVPDAKEPDIRRAYIRQMFDQFFKASKTSKDQGRVGQ